MRYLSVCSGIEAASVAWEPLGWEPVAFAEIEAFPSAVLKAHYPNTPNLGDMTKFEEWPDFANVSLLVGGTPCQSYSVAGLRRGLADPRGSLMLVFGAIARRYRPRWIVWENVPGVLSSNGGRDFGAFLGMLGELGYRVAYRVLDAQYFGLAQRRKRVFVVAHSRDWRPAAAVLFDRASMRGDPAPSRKARKDVAPTLACSSNGGGANGPGRSAQDADSLIAPAMRAQSQSSHRADSEAFVASTVSAKWAKGRGGYAGQNETENCVITPVQDPAYALGASPGAFRSYGEGQFNYVTHSLRADGFDAGEDGTGRGTPLVPVAFAQNTRDEVRVQGDGDISGALAAEPGMKQTTYLASSTVRRLTPRECERLQGFPDDYTLITYRKKPAADGPRYKALGNSMAVPVMRWIGERIERVERIMREAHRA